MDTLKINVGQFIKEKRIMEKEEIVNNESEQTNVSDNSANYIEAIKEMKKNTVDKAAYEKLKEENKQLLTAFMNGEKIEAEIKKEPVDIDKLRQDLFNNENNNLEYITKALQLRDELIARGEKDPFLPCGSKIIPTEEDVATANRVAEKLKECIEYADGDSDIFTNELQRIMVDTSPITNTKRR